MTFEAALRLSLVLLSCSCALVWGERTLFVPGNEYTYSYDTLVTTGTEEPTGYASAYKVSGILRIQAESDALNVKLDDLKIGLYNGPWTYFPMPQFQLAPSAALSSLGEPFQIQTESGKVKMLVMNDQEPEWASNMKRGIASFLQMDLSVVKLDKVELLKVTELTTMGECETHYEILPAAATRTGTPSVSKFRNHADCLDIPSRTRFSNKIFYACPDKHTQNILNSTSYSTYDLDDSLPDRLTIKRFTLYSSALYWPFTVTSPYLYNWLNYTLGLVKVSPTVNPIPTPENPENHEDLSYVFEQNDLSDPEEDVVDLRLAEPLMFHHTSGENEPTVLHGIMEQLHRTTTEVAQSLTENFNTDDVDKFHRNSPFVIIPLISSLDFDSLKHCYQRYSDAQSTGGRLAKIEFQLFLDGLTLAGSSPAALVVRDILLTSQDPQVMSRLIPSFPHFLRNPSEALGKELDPIFDLTRKSSLSKTSKRMLELSMASLISKCCAKTLCTTSELLTKYITYFEEKLTSENFEIQTVGVLGLRNLGIGHAMDKLLDIATRKINVPQTVRVQAIWSLRPLAYTEKNNLFESLLPVFYNRSEECEIRTSIFSFLMSCRPEKRILHEIAYFMWTETCPQTSNIVRSTLINLGNSKHPCGKEIQSYAKTILKYLPPGGIDPFRTTSYAIDYYDEDHGFGHMTYATVQKSGSTALPISVYIGLNGFIGGFATGYLGLFIRMEGLGKAVTSKLASLRSANINEIQSILSTIGVKARPDTPLKLELAIIYHEKVIVYYAADERTFDSLPQFVKKLGDLKNSISLDWQQSTMLGGVLYQQPMELGIPITIVSSISAIGMVASTVTRGKSGGVLSQDAKTNVQLNTFGITQIANHLPSLGTTFSVTAQRSLRVNLPRHVAISLDVKNQALGLSLKPPAENNPAILVAHATTKTSVTGDIYGAARDLKAKELLQASCPTCSPVATVSKGQNFRKSRTRDFKPRFVKGIKSTFKYFDCERQTSRSSLLNRLKHILDPSSKNAGIFQSRAAKASLGLTQAADALFLSPYGETCGVAFSLSQDSAGGNALEQVEAKLKAALAFPTEQDPKWKSTLESKVNFKYASGKSLNTESYLSVSQSAVNNHEVNLKLVAHEEGEDKIGVICLNVESEQNFVSKDILSYSGDNAPHANQTAHLRLGKLSSTEHKGKDTSCANNHADIVVNIDGRQSDEQLAESQLDVPPYSICRAQQQGGALYPGSTFVPPTPECYAAALEQTNLRRLNISINYKVTQDVRKRWRKPLGVVEGLLLPYYLDTDDETSASNVLDHQHSEHDHVPDSEGMSTGEIELDLNIKRDEPTMDVHYHRGEGNKEQHFHGFELNLLPEILRPKPVPTRFTPLGQLGLKLGVIGICSASPAVVQSLDGITLPAALPECLTLLSADCGKRPQYAILAKRTSPTTVAIVIHIQDRKIELDGVSVKLDGQSVAIQDGTVKELPLSHAKIQKNGEELNVISGHDGLYIRYTGGFVTLYLGSRYRGSQCGICGSWDSSPYNDVSGPDATCPRPMTPAEFFNSYVLRDGDCSGVGQACPS